MPLLYSQIGLTNQEYSRKKKEKEKERGVFYDITGKRHSSRNIQLVGFNEKLDKNKFKSYKIDEEDERFS